jgi:hypothetical protein
MDSLLAMPPNFQPRRMDPVDIDHIGFLAVPEKEISPASLMHSDCDLDRETERANICIWFELFLIAILRPLNRYHS